MGESAEANRPKPAWAISRRGFLKSSGALIGCVAYGGGVHYVLSDDGWEPNRSYWLAKTTGEPYGRAEGTLRVDVAVIGGGCTGLSAAYHIKRRFPELRVALLEAQRLGFGASGRNGGLLVEGTAVSDEMPGTEGNVGFVRSLIEEHDLECELAGKRLDPYQLVLSLGRLCAQQGIMVFERSQVRRVVPAQPVVLLGDVFRVEADRVVLGTNAYTPKLGFFDRELLPIHHGCVVTERLGAVFESLPPTFTQPIGNGADYYWGRKLPDRRLLLGGGLRYSYDNGLSFRGAGHLYAALARGMRGMFPRLGNTRIEYQWNGPLGIFADSQPRLGMTGDHANVYYALGYAGIGIAMATRFGSLVSEMLDGIQPPAWTRKRAAKLPGEPFRYMFVNAGLHLVDFGMLRV